MKRRTFWAAIALTTMATATLTGCSKESDDENRDGQYMQDSPSVVYKDMTLTRAELEMVNHSNEFAFNLFRAAQDETKSQILSPISITYALGMLNNGAAGDTQAQINKVLGFGNVGADSINTFCYKMLMTAPVLDPLTKVMIANTIYMNKGYQLLPDFVEKAWAYYKAEPETRDFHDGLTMDVINQWASDHTEQMIKKVLNASTFNPDAVSYLLNAIYFKGTWTKKFDKAETADGIFEKAGLTGEATTLPMMHQMATLEYGESGDYQALRLPYGNGSFLMTVLLPKTNTSAVPQVPTAEAWQQLNQNMASGTVDVKLPRFETETDIDLKGIMTNLGMPDAFNSEKADFSNFCNRPTYIGMMKQVAKIKLDEEGTEAAAVTVIGDATTAIGPEPGYVTFHANHPFLYVISEKQSGAVLFIGQYTGN